jgi:hypothetical protein
VVVVVTVVIVCWVAGPKESCAMVECCGGIMVVDVLVDREAALWLRDASSAGDAGAVDRTASEASVREPCCKPKPTDRGGSMAARGRGRW